ANRALDAHTPQNRLRAVVTGTDSDALLVERDTYILGSNIVENEREHARFLTRCADQLQAWYGEQTRRGVVQKLVFIGSNTFHADLFDIVERGAEPNRVRNIAGARFKPRRSYVAGGLLEGDIHNHVAAAFVAGAQDYVLIAALTPVSGVGSKIAFGDSSSCNIDSNNWFRERHPRHHVLRHSSHTLGRGR